MKPTRESLLQRIGAGRTDLVFEHVSQGGNASDMIHGASLLQWCAYYGDVSAMRYLLDRGAALASLGNDLGLSAAAFHSHWQLCQFLLERGANANAVNAAGETALHAAVSSNRAAQHWVVKVLLQAGADPNLATINGRDTGAFMRDCRTRGETPLHRAAAFASESTIELLLAAGANREVKDANGDSALSWASWHLRPDSVLRLLCYGEHQIRADRKTMEANLRGEVLD